MKTLKLKVQIPCPGRSDGAMISCVETGETLPVRSLDLHIDCETMLPTMILEIFEGNEALIEGTWRCEMIREEPPE